MDPFTTALTVRGHSGGVINATYVECASNCPAETTLHPTVNQNHMPAIFYLDWSANYVLRLGGLDSAAFFNIRNLENKPHPALSVFGSSFGNGALPTAYDVDGRIYRVGLRFKMP